MNYSIIENKIKNSDNIFVMGHNGVDLDAFGACLGIYYLLNHLTKPCYIILDEEKSDTSIIKAKEELVKRKYNVEIVDYQTIKNKITTQSLLIVVDVNRRSLLQNAHAPYDFKQVVILDHHKESEDSIPNTIYKYINEKYSSTSEIVLELLKKYEVNIPNFVASIMLGGIVVDTNNFTLKTSDATYEHASYLTKLGANNEEVQYLLKKNFEEYFNIQKTLENVIIIENKYAVCVCDNNNYDKEFLAKIASTLLTFDGIEISFAIGKIDEDTIGISTRSTGNIDAVSYMKKLGGGGHNTDAACQLKNITINEAEEKLLNIIKEG